MKSDLAGYALSSKRKFKNVIENHVEPDNFTLKIDYIEDSYIDYKYIYFTVTNNRGTLFSIKFGMYPGCCGGLATWSLSFDKDYKDMANELIAAIGNVVHRNCISYITNFRQNTLINFFNEYGWQKADLGINNNSDNRLTMWTYNPNGVKEI